MAIVFQNPFYCVCHTIEAKVVRVSSVNCAKVIANLLEMVGAAYEVHIFITCINCIFVGLIYNLVPVLDSFYAICFCTVIVTCHNNYRQRLRLADPSDPEPSGSPR